MATATPYKNPDEATAALNAAASEDGSLSDTDKAAVASAAALVPGAAASPVVSPIQRTIDPGTDAADKYLSTFHAPETADQIAERMRQGSQGSIDAINKVYDDQVSANNVIGQERLAQDNAISVLSGLTGSTEAGRTRGATLDKNDKETQAINNERLLKLQSLYTRISQQARDEAQRQREDATADANTIVNRDTIICFYEDDPAADIVELLESVANAKFQQGIALHMLKRDIAGLNRVKNKDKFDELDHAIRQTQEAMDDQDAKAEYLKKIIEEKRAAK